jgi:hypothetical protein
LRSNWIVMWPIGYSRAVKRAAALTPLLLLGFLAGTAVPGRSAAPDLITTALPTITTTLPVSTTLPKITTTLPVSTTLPKITTTLPVSTTLPKITTTLPVSTTVPKITTTLPLSTTVPKITTTLPLSTTLPKITTTLPLSTTVPKITTTLPTTHPTTATTTAQTSASSAGPGAIFPSLQNGGSFLSGGNGSAAPGAASASLFSASSGGPSAAAPAVTRLHSSRPSLVLHGPKARRSAILVFHLRHAGRVRFTVVEVFPLCRVVGVFTVRGHAGINRFRFNGRVHGKRLPAGTYQIGLRTKRARLLRVTIAIFDSVVGSPSVVTAARKRNVCGAAMSFSFSSALGFGPTVVEGRSAAAGSSSPSGTKHVLGVDVTALAPQILAREIGKNPFAIIALGLAVLLLGLAAVPQAATPGPRIADLLARQRSLMILAGGVAIAVGVILLALS